MKGVFTSPINVPSQNDYDLAAADIDQLDITDLEAALACMESLKPRLVINCAAYTDVNGCETNAELAFKVNALGPRNLALGCARQGAALVHFSTDYVFDGEKGRPYAENDAPNPLNIYGKSKLEGENHIKDNLSRFFIIRTQWLFGQHGKNFVDTILTMGAEGKEIRVVNDQFGSPTYAKDLCLAVRGLINTQNYGTYHITNQGVTSWYGFAKEIFRQAGKSGVAIKPCSAEDYPSPAKRPKYSALKNSLPGPYKMPPYEEALSGYLKNAGRLAASTLNESHE